MGYSISVITGRTSPALVEPLAGNRWVFTAKVISSSVPMIKDGIETKAVVTIMIIRSKSVFRRRAAIEPRMTPRIVAKAAAIRPSFAETFIPSVMMSMTIRPRCFRDGPKSKRVMMSFRYVTYCVNSGLSSPYFASREACTAGVTAFSPMKGPPGTACMIKNVSVMTTQIVNTAKMIRFTKYFRVDGFILSPFAERVQAAHRYS